jgi:hypothetical protein
MVNWCRMGLSLSRQGGVHKELKTPLRDLTTG